MLAAPPHGPQHARATRRHVQGGKRATRRVRSSFAALPCDAKQGCGLSPLKKASAFWATCPIMLSKDHHVMHNLQKEEPLRRVESLSSKHQTLP